MINTLWKTKAECLIPVFEASAEAGGGPAAAAAEPVAAGPVVPGEATAVDTPTTAAHCVGVRADVTDIPVLGELTVPVPPGYTALASDITGVDIVDSADEDEATVPAVFWRMKVVAAVVVFALFKLLTVDSEDTGIKPTPPPAVLTNAPLCPFAIAKGSWIKSGWMDTDWPPDVVGVVVMTPVLGPVFNKRVPGWDWPVREVEEGVELVVVEMICKMGAGETSAEEVGVVGVDRGLGCAGIAGGQKTDVISTGKHVIIIKK